MMNHEDFVVQNIFGGINNDDSNTCFFIWFGDPYLRIGVPTNFCGAFFPLSPDLSSKVIIRSKSIVDKVNFLSGTKSIKTGNEHFDAKAIISGSLDPTVNRLLSKAKVQNKILDALSISANMTISMNAFNLDFVPELKVVRVLLLI